MPMCVRFQQDDDVKYKGISRQKWSARWDSHVVDLKSNTTLYLGYFDAREKAARAHDVAFLKLNGPQITTPGEIDSKLNFPSSDYADLNGTLTAEQKRIWREDVASLCPSHMRREITICTHRREDAHSSPNGQLTSIGRRTTGIADVSADAIMAALRRESEDGSAMKASKFRGVYRSDNGSEWEARLGNDSPLVPYRTPLPAGGKAKPKKGIHPLPTSNDHML